MIPTTEAGQEQRAAELTLLEDTVKRFNEAFNRLDAAEVASFWTDDGTLLSPFGTFGEGRDGVESVFQADASTMLEGTTSLFTVSRVRRIGAECALLDVEHELRDGRMPDGTRGTLKFHVVTLAQKEGDEWRWLDCRPYRFAERPPPMH